MNRNDGFELSWEFFFTFLGLVALPWMVMEICELQWLDAMINKVVFIVKHFDPSELV